jgi:hypothetical protein
LISLQTEFYKVAIIVKAAVAVALRHVFGRMLGVFQRTRIQEVPVSFSQGLMRPCGRGCMLHPQRELWPRNR